MKRTKTLSKRISRMNDYYFAMKYYLGAVKAKAGFLNTRFLLAWIKQSPKKIELNFTNFHPRHDST